MCTSPSRRKRIDVQRGFKRVYRVGNCSLEVLPLCSGVGFPLGQNVGTRARRNEMELWFDFVVDARAVAGSSSCRLAAQAHIHRRRPPPPRLAHVPRYPFLPRFCANRAFEIVLLVKRWTWSSSLNSTMAWLFSTSTATLGFDRSLTPRFFQLFLVIQGPFYVTEYGSGGTS